MIPGIDDPHLWLGYGLFVLTQIAFTFWRRHLLRGEIEQKRTLEFLMREHLERMDVLEAKREAGNRKRRKSYVDITMLNPAEKGFDFERELNRLPSRHTWTAKP